MSVEDNKVIAQRFAQVWTAGCLDIVDELAAPDIVVSYPIPPEPMRGPAAFKAFLAELMEGLPDAVGTGDDMITEGDKVACRWSMRGTHKGQLFGIPATGKNIEISGFTLYRIAGGKIVEESGIGNTLGLMQQLGAIAGPAEQ